MGKGVSRTTLERQALDALNLVPYGTVFSGISCFPFCYLALLATQAAAAKEQSGEWATWEDAKLGSRQLSTVGLTKILYDDFVNDQLNVLDQLVDFFGLDRYNFETKQKYNVSGAPKNRFYKVLSELINKESSLKSLFKKYMPKNIIIHLTHKVKKELYKKVILTQKEKEILLNIYKDDIVALQSIINNDLKHWLK